jgi:ubiquinone/menaquinone biosynthesis C-methylase UbiE
LRASFGYLRRCRRILDVGSGTGEFIRLAPRRIIGIDTNRQRQAQVKFGSATAIPYPKNSFDGLHCSHVIEHLEPKQVYRFFKEASRVLEPGGILVISSPMLWSGFYDNLTHIKPYPPRAITRYLMETAPDTTYPLIKAKFKLVALRWRYRYFTKTGYTLVLRKC